MYLLILFIQFCYLRIQKKKKKLIKIIDFSEIKKKKNFDYEEWILFINNFEKLCKL